MRQSRPFDFPVKLLSAAKRGRGRGPLRGNGKVRGESMRHGNLNVGPHPLTLPTLRVGPLPLPQGGEGLYKPTPSLP